MKYKTSVIIMQNAFQIVILFEFKFGQQRLEFQP